MQEDNISNEKTLDLSNNPKVLNKEILHTTINDFSFYEWMKKLKWMNLM